MKYIQSLCGTFIVLTCLGVSAMAAGTVDRDYGLGDDPAEGASPGGLVGGGNSFGLTFDSMGTPGFGDLQDMDVGGAPVYANVSDRPLFDGGLGVSFNGSSDFLFGPNLNLPDTSAASVNHDDDPSGTSLPGPLNYVDIVDRYFQFWAKPDGTNMGNTQSLVVDTNQHGVRIVNDTWSLRYGGSDVDSAMAVAYDQWSHVMVARPFGPAGGGRLYVNGIAVAAEAGDYDGAATEELVVGSNTGRDSSLNFTGGTDEFYQGLIDDLTMVVLGDNTSVGGQDWGSFEFQVDNQFAADAMSGVDPADVNLDGVVAGDGSGPAASDDVRAFVDGWRSRNELNGVLVGDLSTRMSGDLDFDGIVDLRDFSILNAANPSMALAIRDQLAIPEPSSALLGLFALAGMGLFRRR